MNTLVPYLEKAIEKKIFNKVSKHNLKVSENFIDIVEKLLKQKALDSINIARKSGALLTGFEKVKEAIKKNNVEFLIQAIDAGHDGKEKMALLAKSLEIFNLFSIDELDATLNKSNTVHIAILKNDMSRMVYHNLEKYQNFLS
jgi:ribosomal protein L7Ae-like RNA K-turn-binding protein